MHFLKNFFSSLAFLCPLFCLSGCTFFDTDKPPLQGKREAILDQEPLPQKDSATHMSPIIHFFKDNTWKVLGGSRSHSLPPQKLSSDLERLDHRSIYVKRPGSFNNMQPLIEADVAYVIDYRNYLQAIDLRTFNEIWSYKPTITRASDDLTGGIALHDDKIILSTTEGKVFLLNKKTGSLVWETDLKEPLRSAPTVGASNIILQTKSNKIYALDLISGDVAWNFSVPAENLSFMTNVNPAIRDNKVFAVFSSGDIVMLRADNGAVLWREQLNVQANKDELSLLADTRALPIFDNTLVFVTNQQQLIAFDQRHGKQVWEKSLKSHRTPFVTKDGLFVLDDRGYVYALEKDTGRVVWRSGLPTTKHERFGPIVTSSGVLVINDNQALFLDINDGSLKTSAELEATPLIAPVVVDEKLYILDADQNLSMYGPKGSH